FGPRAGHRLEQRHADPLGFAIARCDEHIAPDPGAVEVAGDRRLVIPGGAHGIAIERDTVPGHLERLDVHQKWPPLPSQLRERMLSRGAADDWRMRGLVGARPQIRHLELPELALM